MKYSLSDDLFAVHPICCSPLHQSVTI